MTTIFRSFFCFIIYAKLTVHDLCIETLAPTQGQVQDFLICGQTPRAALTLSLKHPTSKSPG